MNNQFQIALYKVREGKMDTWKQWYSLLNTQYRAEAVETLREEGLTYESCFGFQVNTEWYVLGVSAGEAKPANMEKPLNKKHREVRKECLEKTSEPLEVLYEIK